MAIDFDILARDLVPMAERLCEEWYPAGKRRGKNWVIGNVFGEKTSNDGSLNVNLEDGGWKDYATNETGSNLISLYAAKEHLTNGEAAKKLVERYGLGRCLGAPKALPARFVAHKPPVDAPAPTDRHDGLWKYTDSLGDPLFYVSRHNETAGVDENGKQKKRFCQWSWDGNTWVRKAYHDPRPLYGLHYLANSQPDERVLIVEGEKCVDAARQLFGENAIVMTWPGGASAVSKTDWRPLKDREVTILPDCDDAGRKAAKEIGHILNTQGCQVKIVDTNNPPRSKWDIADAVSDGWTRQAFMEWVRPRLRSYTDALANVQVQQTAVQVLIENPQTDVICPQLTHQHLWRQLGLQVNRQGSPLPNGENVVLALQAMGKDAPDIWWDLFFEQTMIMKDGREEQYTDMINLQLLRLFQGQLGMGNISKSIVWEGVQSYAMTRPRNCAEDYLRSVQWDGVPRIDSFFTDAMGAESSEYCRAASKNFFLGMVARVCRPGSKCDHMVILQGKQGIGKSTLLRLLCGRYFKEVVQGTFNPRELLLCVRGAMLVEMGELHVFRTADITALKSFITAEQDEIRNPYDRQGHVEMRRFTLVGTTNEEEFLSDPTGNRRFWPIRCGKLNRSYVQDNRGQLFAEALVRYDKGEEWWEIPNEEALDEQEMRRHFDPWEEDIAAKAVQLPLECTLNQIFTTALNREQADYDNKDKMRLARCLAALGWTRTSKRKDGRVTRMWVQPSRQGQQIPLPPPNNPYHPEEDQF